MREGWKSVLIKDVARVVNGGTPKTKVSDYWGGHHLWITPAEMGQLISPYLHESKRKLTDAGLQNCSASLVPAHSVILSTRAPIGHLVINSVPMAFNQGCRGLVPSERILYKYLYYFLGFNVELLNDLGSGTTFKELSAGKLKSVEIPLPPLPEQKRIVAILDEAFAGIDTAIANTEKNLANARELFESYLNSVFSQGEEEWLCKTLSEVCEGKITDGTHQTPKYFDEGYIFLSSRNVTSGEIDWDRVKYIDHAQHEAMQKRISPRLGDILLAKNGTTGVAAIVDREVQFDIYVSLAFLRPRDVIPRFMWHFINSPVAKKQFNKRLKGVGVPNLHLTEIRQVEICFPENKEAQERVVSGLDDMLHQKQVLESIYQQKLIALAELKQSLLQKAFSGELTADSADAVDTVEAALA